MRGGGTEVVLEVKKVTSGTLKANVPYVIKTTQSGDTQIHISNVTLHKAESKAINCQSVTHDYTFTGIYEAKSDFNKDENVTNGIFDYTLKGGLFYELIKTATLSPMRWYLTISNRNKATETPSAQPARVKSVTIKVVGEGEATGIENIHVITEGNLFTLPKKLLLDVVYERLEEIIDKQKRLVELNNKIVYRKSEKFRRIYKMAELFAKSDMAVMILGDNGTGNAAACVAIQELPTIGSYKR